jgi:hypothetical protein
LMKYSAGLVYHSFNIFRGFVCASEQRENRHIPPATNNFFNNLLIILFS